MSVETPASCRRFLFQHPLSTPAHATTAAAGVPSLAPPELSRSLGTPAALSMRGLVTSRDAGISDVRDAPGVQRDRQEVRAGPGVRLVGCGEGVSGGGWTRR